MKIYAIDWATKKDLTVYDGKKVKSIANTLDEFDKFLDMIGGGAIGVETKSSTKVMPPSKENKPGGERNRLLDRKSNSLNAFPSILLFEEGGADMQKLKAYRAGHKVLTIPGKKIRDYRVSLNEEKSDEKDAELIYKYFIKEGGGARENLTKGSRKSMPPSSLVFQEYEKEGGSAKAMMTKSSNDKLPSSFRLFHELDADIAEVKILFREHEDLKETMVREKNKLFAFSNKYKLANVASNQGEKIIFSKKASIKEKEKQLGIIKLILKDKVKKFPIWKEYLKDIKGVGPVIAAGLIGEIGNKTFDSKESIKHYSGIMPRAEGYNFNRKLKVILFQFIEGVVKHKTPKWREMYDSIKAFYADKHEDWSKGKCNNFAKKFVESKFIVEYWKKRKEII